MDIVRASAGHLLSLIKADGSYIYAHDFRRVDRVVPGYNLMRHAGATWFLLGAVRRMPITLTESDLARLLAAIRYILVQLRAPPRHWGPLPMLDLVEGGRTKTGGAALVILMLDAVISASQAEPRLISMWPRDTPRPADIIPRLRNSLVRERRGGDFTHMRDLATGRALPFRSNYYTGQALFALIRTGFGAAAAEGLAARMATPAGSLNHWLLYAASEAILQDLPVAPAAWAYIEREVAAYVATPLEDKDAGSVPIACSSEGLLAACRAAAHLGRDRAPFLKDVEDRLRANLRHQAQSYGEGQFRLDPIKGAVQIDAIQHNAESFLGFAELIARPKSS